MRTIYILAPLILFYMTGYGQIQRTQDCAIPDEVHSENTNLIISYTIGETFIHESTKANIHLSEGVIHPKIEKMLHIRQFSKLENLKVFPNPAQDVIQLKFEKLSNYEVHIYDFSGKEVLGAIVTLDYYQMDISNLPVGMYLLYAIDKINQKVTSCKIQKI